MHVLSSCRGALKVQLLFAREFLAVLADDQLQAGHVVPVVPLLFTQGVNGKQNFTNKQELVSFLSLSPSPSLPHCLYYSFTCRQQLQEDINMKNMDILANYFEKYEKMTESMGCKL